MNYNVLLLLGLSCFLSPVYADFRLEITLPLKFTTINPCNGELVKISGNVKEVITSKPSPDGKNKIVILQHDFSHVDALGVASELNYRFVTKDTISSVTLDPKGGTIAAHGPVFYMTPPSAIAPVFILYETMRVSMNENGLGGVGYDEFKSVCPKS